MSGAVEEIIVKSSKASKHKKEVLNTTDVKMEQPTALHETSEDEPASILSELHVVDKELHGGRILPKEYLDQLAFMEEPVTVSFHQSHERWASPFVDCAVNGKGLEALHKGRWVEFFQVPVNQPVTIKRKYLEVFARCKHTDVKAYSTGGHTTGTQPVNHTEPSENLKHPFSVLHDANPRGADWLLRILTDRA